MIFFFFLRLHQSNNGCFDIFLFPYLYKFLKNRNQIYIFFGGLNNLKTRYIVFGGLNNQTTNVSKIEHIELVIKFIGFFLCKGSLWNIYLPGFLMTKLQWSLAFKLLKYVYLSFRFPQSGLGVSVFFPLRNFEESFSFGLNEMLLLLKFLCGYLGFGSAGLLNLLVHRFYFIAVTLVLIFIINFSFLLTEMLSNTS